MKAISGELSQKDKCMLWIWMLRIWSAGRNRFDTKKKKINIGFENNSGQSLLKHFSIA